MHPSSPAASCPPSWDFGHLETPGPRLAHRHSCLAVRLRLAGLAPVRLDHLALLALLAGRHPPRHTGRLAVHPVLVDPDRPDHLDPDRKDLGMGLVVVAVAVAVAAGAVHARRRHLLWVELLCCSCWAVFVVEPKVVVEVSGIVQGKSFFDARQTFRAVQGSYW